MPMMRRGPLARYDAEWVLRQASASASSGSVEFHTDRPLTLYLRNGRVCHAVEGVAETGFAAEPDAVAADEAAARDQVLALVVTAMAATDGWYYLDPIGHHAVATPWDWDAASLILDARIQRRATENRSGAPPEPASAERAAPPLRPDPAARPTAANLHHEADAPVVATAPPVGAAAPVPDRRLELVAPADEQPITLSVEAWRIACALARSRGSEELRDELGWTGSRLDAALAELVAAGVLAATTEEGASAAGAGAAGAAAPATPAGTPTATPPARSEPAVVPSAAPARRDTTTSGPATAAPTPAVRSATPAAPAEPAEPASRPPTVPPLPGTTPKATVDRRSALRRLISNLKPA
ncbi:MAG TPA: hypothetical protein VNS19_08055 [Acidimicrobiales bacterium]|nr:hypothetical protein [Acidimicrobiales bacterium]